MNKYCNNFTFYKTSSRDWASTKIKISNFIYVGMNAKIQRHLNNITGKT